MLVGSSVSRINRLNIHESSSFVLNDISYRLIIAQKQEMKACLFAFYLFLTNWYIQFEELTSMLQWIRNRYWSDCYLFFSTKVSNFLRMFGAIFPVIAFFWLVFIHWIFYFPQAI